MKVTIVGAGNRGAAFAKQRRQAGHRVRITSKSADKAASLAAALPDVVVVSADAALDRTDVAPQGQSQGSRPSAHPQRSHWNIMNITGLRLVTALAFGIAGVSSFAQSTAEKPETPPPPHEKQSPAVEKKLKTFDTLDFDVFSNQKWDRLKESHAADIVVTWPDGHEAKGIDKHIDDLKAMFVFAPDITIKTHPIRFGSGSWTSVSGVMTGTFTQPMPLSDGKSIAPTGKRFALGMMTVGHWTGKTMDHEWLFWDNQDFMNQLGLGK